MIGRWTSVDPYAEKYTMHSTYVYALNNPISNIDLHGDSTINGAGFWRNIWEGVKDGATSTKKLITSLGTENGWLNLFEGLESTPLTSPIPNYGVVWIQGIDNSISNIPNMTTDDWGYATGLGAEKLGEAILLTKGVGLATDAFTSTATLGDVSTLFHSTSSTNAALSIMNDGINPAYFNSASRFGGGFYMSNDIATSSAELSYHGASVTNTLQFSSQGANLLNATSPVMDFGVQFAPKMISGAANVMGYDGIIYNSLRGSGVNVVQFKNFGTLTLGGVTP